MTQHECAICLRKASKQFGAVAAVHEADLCIPDGRLTALLGPSGCGKTTLLRMIAGFEHPDAGEIHVRGRMVSGGKTFIEPERRKVGMVFQDYALFPHLDVNANVAYGLPRDAARASRVGEVLELVGLQGMGRRFPNELSGGQQQRVALARALAPRPDVILLDEPFSNLDSRLRQQVRGEVREILREAKMTAMVVTHDQEEALSIADEIAVMWQGRIVQVGAPADVYWRPVSRQVAAFLGEANFLPGVADGPQIECELGALKRANEEGPCGAVIAMLRPELIYLTRDQGVSGEIVSCEFYGHDQMARVRLQTGLELQVRLGPFDRARPGERVKVGVHNGVIAYAPEPAGAAS